MDSVDGENADSAAAPDYWLGRDLLGTDGEPDIFAAEFTAAGLRGAGFSSIVRILAWRRLASRSSRSSSRYSAMFTGTGLDGMALLWHEKT